ncbi:MAG: hypothetical protein WA746_08770 [Isosphaeraceae bacterium]
MPVDYTEKGFEQAIEDHLLHHGHRNGDPANFDASPALDTKTLIKFLSVTQKDEWGRLNNSGDTILNLSKLGMVSPELSKPEFTGREGAAEGGNNSRQFSFQRKLNRHQLLS